MVLLALQLQKRATMFFFFSRTIFFFFSQTSGDNWSRQRLVCFWNHSHSHFTTFLSFLVHCLIYSIVIRCKCVWSNIPDEFAYCNRPVIGYVQTVLIYVIPSGCFYQTHPFFMPVKSLRALSLLRFPFSILFEYIFSNLSASNKIVKFIKFFIVSGFYLATLNSGNILEMWILNRKPNAMERKLLSLVYRKKRRIDKQCHVKLREKGEIKNKGK